MVLTPEVIEMAEKEVAIAQYFSVADEATASHVLYQNFKEGTKWKGLPKLIFYIIMENAFGAPNGKDSAGNLGYKLSFNNPEKK